MSCIPKTAQYYLPMNDDPDTACLFYRLQPVQMNDGTTRMALQYYSSCGTGGWQGSTEKNPERFIAENLIRLTEENSAN